MLKDKYLLSKRLKNKNADLNKIADDVEISILKVNDRARCVPKISYPDLLPVSARKEDIKSLIDKNQVIILSGETGSGKTTQIPKICLELGYGVKGLIGHTQPRRIAARTVATRIAEELNTKIGDSVGFKMRFSDHVKELTHIKLMTDGILLAEIQSDRLLLQYEVIIIDEAHERSLNIDFILGYLKLLLPKRRDLKVIITSATIDTDKFSTHFNNAPVIEVSGRTYPVDIKYHELNDKDEDASLQKSISETIFELNRNNLGDTLVFLPGEREIRETAEYLRKHHPPHTEILPLFSRLSVKDQEKIFRPHQGNRVVLATNVAETSLTVPGIRYVVDSGLARMSRYSVRNRIQRLPIEKISQAAANQRAGRCGRVSAGVCVRLYAEADYYSRPEFTDPEILRVNLASVILQMLSLCIGDIFDYPFINKPEKKYINDGLKLLEEIGAVTTECKVTDTGRQLAKLPVDPRLGKMLITANKENCLKEIIVIVAFLSIQDPRERPFEAQQKSDEFHNRFSDKISDFSAVIKLWEYIQEQSRSLSQNKFRQLCKKEFLSYMRIREWKDIVIQLKNAIADLNMKVSETASSYNAVHCALLSGLLSNIGYKSEDSEFLGTRQKKFFVFPGSYLQKNPPKWIIASEIVETTRNFGRMAAKIEPEWIVSLAEHIIKRSYFEPHWQKKSGQVSAFEKTTLYGLTLIAKKRVSYSAINREESREIFIRRALVEGEIKFQPSFLKHNLALVQDIELLESKSRRPNILVSDEEMYQFYDGLIPVDVCNEVSFKTWLKQNSTTSVDSFKFTAEQITRDDAEEVSQAQYPESININGFSFTLKYTFTPGIDGDGVTVIVPLGLLSNIEGWWFDWLVPGMIKDKVIALIKSLPKSTRKYFVPVPDFAEKFIRIETPYKNAFMSSLSRYLSESGGLKVSESDFDFNKIPQFLNVTYDLVDEDKNLLLSSSDIEYLKTKFKSQSSRAILYSPIKEQEREIVTTWDFDELPSSRVIETEHGDITVFPALVYEKKALSLNNFSSLKEAEKFGQNGLLQLVKMSLTAEIKLIKQKIPAMNKMCLLYSKIDNCLELTEELIDFILKKTYMSDWKKIRTRELFESTIEINKVNVENDTIKISSKLLEILLAFQQCNKALKKVNSPSYLEALADINEQIKNLIYRHFLNDINYRKLNNYCRYIAAINRRLEKLPRDPLNDRKHMLEVKKYWNKYKAKQDAFGDSAELEEFRWMIEEYRVSLFAQNLKTEMPISAKRLDKHYNDLLKE